MTPRIAIVGGGGGVGSSLAFNLLLRPEPYAVELVDGRSRMARSHEMDLQQVLAQGATGSVQTISLAGAAGADVVVLAAGVPLTVNTSRMVYLHDNAAILATAVAALDGGELLLVVTNPVDPLCTWAVGGLGLERRRVLGYTANDGLRLRSAIARALGAPPHAVEAWALGEHGDGCVPLFERVRVDGRPVALDARRRGAAAAFVRGWYVEHVALDSGRSSTWTTGLGVARMVAALTAAGPAPELWPASVVLAGEYGVDGVALSVPTTLGPAGVERVHEWELTAAEDAALQAAAATVRAAAETL